MFSARTEWEFHPNALTLLLAEKHLAGDEILDLTESNPTRCGFDYLPQFTLEALATRRSLVYEPNPKGILPARTAVADYYQRQGITINPDHIILTSGTSEAYGFLLRLLCNPRDSVALLKPGYPLFDDLCQLQDVVGRPIHLSYYEGWILDLEAVKVELAARAKAILLVHPNNPTGSYIRHDERNGLIVAVDSLGGAIVSDEVFHPFQFEGEVPPGPSFAANERCLTFTVNGISKLLGLPQLKCGWIVVTGPEAEVEAAVARLEIISDLFLSVGTPVQQALPLLMEDPAGLTIQIRNRIRRNLRHLEGKLHDESGVELLRGEGGWNAVLRMPPVKRDEEWAYLLLKNRNVLVHPGSLFGFDERSILVVSLLQKEEIFREGVAGILAAIDV